MKSPAEYDHELRIIFRRLLVVLADIGSNEDYRTCLDVRARALEAYARFAPEVDRIMRAAGRRPPAR